ncbi:MAG: hypothetical protein R2710_29270 [Acidimicrobiales bacterium]
MGAISALDLEVALPPGPRLVEVAAHPELPPAIQFVGDGFASVGTQQPERIAHQIDLVDAVGLGNDESIPKRASGSAASSASARSRSLRASVGSLLGNHRSTVLGDTSSCAM